MSHQSLFRAAARCWERAGHFERAAGRYARADAWVDAGRCWAQAGRPDDAAAAYARVGEPIREARQWLASPWPERARRPYRQALETGLSTSAEVEALLGLGEFKLASERAFKEAPENGRSVEALRSLARLAAARGRPDLAARAWGQAMGWSPTGAREVFEDWERSAPWNRSLGWRRPPSEASGWPSRAFRDVRLELVWEEELGFMMFGNRGLAWSADGRRFAASKEGALILGNLTAQRIRYQSVEMKAISVAFIPGSDAVLVGCADGRVVRVGTSGAVEEIETLCTPGNVWLVAFCPEGNRVAISSLTSPSDAVVRIWSWDSQGPREMLQERRAHGGESKMVPSFAWSPVGRTLAWCPGPWSENGVSNDFYLGSDRVMRCILAVHENGIGDIAFSPNGRYLVTASLDRTLALYDANSGEVVGSPWKATHRPEAAAFHPGAALLVAGAAEGTDIGSFGDGPGRLFLFRFAQNYPPHLKVIQEIDAETDIMSLSFSPGGEHLLVGTFDRLSMFQVHLI